MASDESEQKQGLQEAHTPPEIPAERAAKIGATAAATEAAMADLAGQFAIGQAEAEQPSLMLDEADEQLALFAGPVRHVAETIAAARNGRGRPKGSQNKASQRFAETLQRMGYRHPGLNLAALANADPHALARELSFEERDKNGVIWRVGCTPKEAMDLILKANAELMPYFESKAPTKIEVDERVMGVMVIGEMKAQPPDDGAVMNLTRVDKPE